MNRFCYGPKCPVTTAADRYTVCMPEFQSITPLMTSFINRICDVIVFISYSMTYKGNTVKSLV